MVAQMLYRGDRALRSIVEKGLQIGTFLLTKRFSGMMIARWLAEIL